MEKKTHIFSTVFWDVDDVVNFLSKRKYSTTNEESITQIIWRAELKPKTATLSRTVRNIK